LRGAGVAVGGGVVGAGAATAEASVLRAVVGVELQHRRSSTSERGRRLGIYFEFISKASHGAEAND
jgi:hypothetical protein